MVRLLSLQEIERVKEQYEAEIIRLQGLLYERENHCAILEGEMRKAQTIYHSDDAKQVRRRSTMITDYP